ncbi:nuclear transport factor 2 family protein [Mycobacterium simiae]|uniref:nuclear transport factor 2 family protein n=1 Tax=Mycobacterium simiae TaxID=1784 RepID=UPI00111C3A87|nr:nuclear transport factor 2 family protein [Mycobacterium simiae]
MNVGATRNRQGGLNAGTKTLPRIGFPPIGSDDGIHDRLLFGLVCDGDTAAVWGHFGGTLATDSFLGMPAVRGSSVEVPVAFVCTVRDGVVTSDRGYFDRQTFVDQLIDYGPARYVDVFQQFWRTKDPQLVADVLADDAEVSWPGLPIVSGSDYPALLRHTSTAAIPDMSVETVSHAESVDEAFIRWRATGTINGQLREWSGVDSIRFRGGRVIRIDAIYDTADLS